MRLGANQLQALQFVHRYKGWHYFQEDATTKNIMRKLKTYKFVSIDKYGRFKITKLGNRYIWEHTNKFYL